MDQQQRKGQQQQKGQGQRWQPPRQQHGESWQQHGESWQQHGESRHEYEYGHGQEQPGPQRFCGGESEQPVTPEIQSIADSLRADVEQQLQRTFDEYVVVIYKTQFLGEMNHLLKIHCGKDEYLHVTVYEKLPHAGSVRSVLSVMDGRSFNDAF